MFKNNNKEVFWEILPETIMTNYFSERIRQQRKEKGMTQQMVATALGVGQTTVANYENGTRLPDFEKLSAYADLFGVTVDYLLGRSAEQQSNQPPNRPEAEVGFQFSDYMDSLLACDKNKAVRILLSILASGRPGEELYTNFMERALKEVGRMWERGDLPIWKEHCISEITLESMALIKERNQVPVRDKKTLLALVPGAETHSIGLRMISDRLETQGFQIIFLGSNIPTENILQAIRENKPEAILLSVTMSRNVDTVVMIIDKIKQSFGTRAPAILIGGAAFEGMKQVENITGTDKYCHSFDDVVRTLERI